MPRNNLKFKHKSRRFIFSLFHKSLYLMSRFAIEKCRNENLLQHLRGRYTLKMIEIAASAVAQENL